MRNLLLYHGSFMPVRNSKANYNDGTNDFGNGFYLTSDAKQAEKWAKRKAKYYYKTENKIVVACVSQFEISMDDLKHLRFKKYDKVEFVKVMLQCRSNNEFALPKYDVLYGPVADGRTNLLIRKFLKGNERDFEKLICDLKLDRYTDQFCFKTDLAIKKLRYVGDYYVK